MNFCHPLGYCIRAKLLIFHLNQDKYPRNHRCIGNFIVKLENLMWFIKTTYYLADGSLVIS